MACKQPKISPPDIHIDKSRHRETVKSSEYGYNRRTVYKAVVFWKVCWEKWQCVMSDRPSAELFQQNFW